MYNQELLLYLALLVDNDMATQEKKNNCHGNKCNRYRCITKTTTWPLSLGPFRLLANCFLLFCSYLAVLILTMLLA